MISDEELIVVNVSVVVAVSIGFLHFPFKRFLVSSSIWGRDVKLISDPFPIPRLLFCLFFGFLNSL